MGGHLILISGPSGVGKTTICDALLAHPGIRRIVTATSRPPRPGEREGVDYHFLTEEEFRKSIDRGEFLEHAVVHGHLYGTPMKAVEAGIDEGSWILLNIDVQGARQVRSAIRGGLPIPLTTIFIAPPSMEELRRRLEKRGSEDPEATRRRIETARKEMEEKTSYDHFVVNETVSQAAGEILRLIGYKIKE